MIVKIKEWLSEFKPHLVTARIKCWWKHAWEFQGGHWVIPKQLAITKSQCARCGLYREVSQDHVNHLRFLEKEEFRMLPEKVTT